MAKIIKITGRFTGILIEWLFILLILFAFAIRTSPVQTYLAGKATDFLSRELKTTFKIGAVSVIFFDKIALENVLVKDQKGKILAKIPTLYVTLDNFSPSSDKINIKKIKLEKGLIQINRDKKTGDYNYWFITDYFTSDSKGGGKAIDVYLNAIELSDITFKYDDYRKYYSSFGMDYDHLILTDVNLKAENISIIGEVIKGKLSHLSAKEKCGFVLNKLNADCEVSPKGILLDNLQIKTPFSKITAPKLHMLMDRYQCVYSFEDSVSFDAKLDYSFVSLKDISYFGTALEGMDEQIILKADVSKRVKDLKITNLDLKFGERSQLIGTINLPDFRKFEQSFFQEKLDYAYISTKDLKNIKLPKDEGGGYIQLDKYIERLSYFEGTNIKLDGFYSQFVVAASRFNTALGTFRFDNGIMFTENPTNNSYFFERSLASEYDFKIEKFQLDNFLEDKSFGIIDGIVFLKGEAFSLSDIQFKEIEGNLNQFDYLDYSYHDISVEEGTSLIDNILTANVSIEDENLILNFDGKLNFNTNLYDFNVNIKKAHLNELLQTSTPESEFSSEFKCYLQGNSANSISGNVTMTGIKYKEENKNINLNNLEIKIDRSPLEDNLIVESSMFNMKLNGKVDFSTVVNDFENQFSKIFPAIVPPKAPSKKSKRIKSKTKNRPENHFNYDVEIGEINDFLAIFAPDLLIAPKTKLSGNYSGENETFTMDINAPSVFYSGMQFEGITIDQSLSSSALNADYSVHKFYLNDSINVDNLHFTTQGTKDKLNSELIWNPDTKNDSKISWKTDVLDIDKFNILLNPSYFTLKEKRWDVHNLSNILVDGNLLDIDNFLLEREEQYIEIKGRVSSNDNDKIDFKINDLKLNDLGLLLGSPIALEGTVNGWGYLSNPYTNLTYMGDANIQNLFINGNEVGNIFFQSQWNHSANSIGLTGDLIYKNIQTFAFEGNYYTDRKSDNLDFDLLFDKTDIRFTNAFMNPDVMSNIQGLINGSLSVSGTLDEPIIEGQVELLNGNTHLDILGVDLALNGKIKSDKYGFYIDNMPVTDEDGNTGSLNGTIYHNNFLDWNFDVLVNLEDDYYRKDPFSSWRPAPLDKFLVLNTSYKEGDIYYGKGYTTGTVNIFGSDENIEISVNVKTQKDTKIIFPMYGTEEIEEEEDWLIFAKKDSTIIDKHQFDLTGLDLDLNFEVTPDADLKIVFNDKTGDEISAKGNGNISVGLDNMGDVSMEGSFNIKQGNYNFVMGTVKQPLKIHQGSITWTGDPYDAYIDLQTYFNVKAGLAEISPDKINGTGLAVPQDIQCFINLTETLMKPAISFDIKAPKATEEGQNLISRINADPDEKNRQFFSLLLWKRFQPLQGPNSAGGSSVALDLVENQINDMLSQVSKDYKIKLDLDADANGGTSAAVDVSKQFGNRLILTGSFGVENTTDNTTNTQSSLIGDVNLEYMINESGTFRFNIFNESNDNTIIQEKSVGLFTQGAGVHYQEDFNDFQTFKLAQYTLDIFRSKENKRYPIKRKRKQTPIPTDPATLPTNDGTSVKEN